MASLLKRIKLGYLVATNKAVAFFNQDGTTVIPRDYFAGLGLSGNTYQKLENPQDITKALLQAPILDIVIGRISQAAINGVWKIKHKATDKEQSMSGQYASVYKLLQQPNALQSGEQMLQNLCYYTRAFGYCIAIPVEGYDNNLNSYVQSLWLVPPQFCDVVLKTDINPLEIINIRDIVKEIKFTVGNTITRLDISKVYFFTDIEADLVTFGFPTSKLSKLNRPISNIMHNYDAAGSIAKNKMPLGILSNIASGNNNIMPMLPDERQQVQQDFKANYGLSNGQSQVIITSASLQWQEMGFDYARMGLDEQLKRDSEVIAQSFSFPITLLSMDKATFSNQYAAETALYQNAVMPIAKSLARQLSDMLLPNAPCELVLDYSHISALQENILQASRAKQINIGNATTLFNANAITYNRMLLLCGEDKVDGMDLYKYQIQFFNEQKNQENQASTN